MGCGNSTSIQTGTYDFRLKQVTFNEHKLNYDEYKKNYDSSAELLMKIFENFDVKEMLKDDKNQNSESITNMINKFYSDNNSKLKSLGVKSSDQLKFIILLEKSKNFLKTNKRLSIREIDYIDFSKEIFNLNYLKDITKNSKKQDSKLLIKLDQILEKLSYEIPQKMKTFILNMERSFEKVSIFNEVIYENFLFSDKFKFESLILNITNKFLSNNMAITYFNNIIERVKPLYSLALITNFLPYENIRKKNDNDEVEGSLKCLDSSSYHIYHILLKSCLLNESIKVLTIGSLYKSFPIIATPEINRLLMNLIKEDKLVILILQHIKLSQKFYKEFVELLPKLKKLRVLVLNTEVSDTNFKENCQTLFSNCKSLQTVFLHGLNYDKDEDFEYLKENIESNSNQIGIFNYNIESKDIILKEERDREDSDKKSESEGIFILPKFD